MWAFVRGDETSYELLCVCRYTSVLCGLLPRRCEGAVGGFHRIDYYDGTLLTELWINFVHNQVIRGFAMDGALVGVGSHNLENQKQ
jgi:hypothetical protein